MSKTIKIKRTNTKIPNKIDELVIGTNLSHDLYNKTNSHCLCEVVQVLGEFIKVRPIFVNNKFYDYILVKGKPTTHTLNKLKNMFATSYNVDKDYFRPITKKELKNITNHWLCIRDPLDLKLIKIIKKLQINK